MTFHSDNENVICTDSWIVTVSLGCNRTIGFWDRELGKRYNIRLEHGDLICFSKASQTRIKHSVFSPSPPVITTGDSFIPRFRGRVSLTFRKMVE